MECQLSQARSIPFYQLELSWQDGIKDCRAVLQVILQPHYRVRKALIHVHKQHTRMVVRAWPVL